MVEYLEIDRLTPQQTGIFPDRRETGKTTLQQCQQVLIRLLKVFDHICTAGDVQYWMTAGTLIGALRHGGIIPWDCDIDVGMTHEDYAKFLKLVDRLPDDIFFQNGETDPGYPDRLMAKLRDRYSNYYEWQSNHPDARWHNGLQLDIIFYPENKDGQLVNPIRNTAYDKSEIFPLERIEFEGSMLLAPRNPDHYIRRRYGDYMKCPPLEDRIPHEGKADPFRPCDHPESRPYPGIPLPLD